MAKFIGKIYTLSGPDNIPFYVGATIKTVDERLRQHVSEAAAGWRPSTKSLKIREHDFLITATILEIKIVESDNGKKASYMLGELESKWIKKFTGDGVVLTNKCTRVKAAMISEKVGTKIQAERPKKIAQLKVA